MQALKQAAREGNVARLDALCEAWSVSANAANEADSHALVGYRPHREADHAEKERVETVSETEAGMETRR